MKLSLVILGALAVLAVSAAAACHVVDARNTLDEGEFRGAVDRSLPQGASEKEVRVFLEDFKSRDRTDKASIFVGETRRANDKDWWCLPKPCAPMDFGSLPNSLVVRVAVYNKHP